MPKQSDPPTPLAPESLRNKPSMFQKLRGLQQYQHQQEHSSSTTKRLDGSLKVLPREVRSQLIDEGGLHALDPYFARELGMELPTEEELHTNEQTEARLETAAQSSQPIQKVKTENPPLGSKPDFEKPKVKITANLQQSPYRQFITGLSDGDMNYLLRESNATLQALLLKNTSRYKRSQILQQMPRKQRAALLRSWAESNQKLDSDGFLRAFYWLRRKVTPSCYPGNEENYPEISGMKVLSMILDGLEPEQEEKIMQDFIQDDNELAAWLERDRGSARQRQILLRVAREASDPELALLFSIPRYGRLLRHLLDAPKKIDVLNASIDLAQLSQDKRRELESQLFANFPILQKC